MERCQDYKHDFAELIIAKPLGIRRNGWKPRTKMDPFTFLKEICPQKCTIWEIFGSLLEANFRWQKLIVTPRLFIHFINIWERSKPWGLEELERRILILSLLYIITFVNFLFLFKWSNGWLESLGEWTNIFKEEYGIPGCLMVFVLWVKWFYFHYNIFIFFE